MISKTYLFLVIFLCLPAFAGSFQDFCQNPPTQDDKKVVSFLFTEPNLSRHHDIQSCEDLEIALKKTSTLFLRPQFKAISLSIIKFFPHLRTLIIGNNTVPDQKLLNIESVQKVEFLERLLLQRVQLKDLNILNHHPYVWEFRFLGWGLKSLKGIEKATELRYVKINGDRKGTIKDLSPLRTLLKLKSLWINDQKIENITPLMALGNLQELNLSGNTNLKNIEAVKFLTNLEKFTYRCLEKACVNSNLFDLTPFTGLVWLKEFIFADASIKDIGPLYQLEGLEKLHLKNNQIQSLDLTKLSQLVDVDFSGNPLISVNASSLKNLEALSLEMKEVEFLNIKGLTNLEFLYLEAPDLKYMDLDFSQAKKLGSLNLRIHKNMGELKLPSSWFFLITLLGNAFENRHLKALSQIKTVSSLNLYKTKIDNLLAIESVWGIDNLNILGSAINYVERTSNNCPIQAASSAVREFCQK